ncbi:TldD/PmbA family protein [Candidatus Fermentibacteria bacterium]|nr:TldD/PmbA family protein [Candidatus Fermentibacteria bacterium]
MTTPPHRAAVNTDPLAAAIRAVRAAIDSGADAADAYAQTASELQIEVRHGDVEHLQQALTRGLGLRVQSGNRRALVHTTDLSDSALAALAAKAVEIARALPPVEEPFALAAAVAVAPHAHQDPGLAEQSLTEPTSWLVAAERAMAAVKGVSETVSVKWTQTNGLVALANSLGLALKEPSCSITIEAEAIAERDGQSATGACYVSAPSRGSLPEAEWVGAAAGERAAMLLGARPVVSARVPVIFPPWIGWPLLVWLSAALRGDHVVQGRSYFADRLGDAVASSLVTIRDTPHNLAGPGHRSFDGEGTPTKDRALIDRGRLEAYLTDRDSAAKLRVEPGGHAVRDSYREAPNVGFSNLQLQPGTHDPEAIIAATGRGLLVTSLSGWWLNLSPATDAFSSAAMGIWIEDGERAYPVRGISIAGTIREMIQAIDMVGNDLRITGTIATPTFRIAEMSISGM